MAKCIDRQGLTIDHGCLRVGRCINICLRSPLAPTLTPGRPPSPFADSLLGPTHKFSPIPDNSVFIFLRLTYN